MFFPFLFRSTTPPKLPRFDIQRLSIVGEIETYEALDHKTLRRIIISGMKPMLPNYAIQDHNGTVQP